MRKSTLLKVLVSFAIVAALLAAVRFMVLANPYVDCAERLVSSAAPTDVSLPPAYRRLEALWHHRDLFLARMLAEECGTGAPGRAGRLDQMFALGTVKMLLRESQLETLGAIRFGGHNGRRGLTDAARAEWGRPPASLDESELAWLFVVAQMPPCSKQRVPSEADRKFCEDLYRFRLDEVRRIHP